MNRMHRIMALSIIIMIMAGLLGSTPAAAKIDDQFMKNGEVFLMLSEADASKVNKPGIYKLSEYYEDASGKRQLLIAREGDLPSVYITRDGWAGKFEGIAVSKERVCYSFKEKQAENYVTPTSVVYSPEVQAANYRWPGWGKNGWYGGGCAGNPIDYFQGCGAAHTAMGHQTGHVVWWRGQGVGGTDKFKCGASFAPAITFDTTGDKTTSIDGTYVVWPCSIAYEGWNGDPWPKALGPTISLTVGGRKREVSTSSRYLMPSGMWFHDASDRSHRYFDGAGMMKMYAAAVKYRDLYMHRWIPTGAYRDWKTSGAQVQNYQHKTEDKVVFQTFDAKWHIFRATPCGDGCLPGSAAKQVIQAGGSKISISITPFGRSYGLQVINDTSTKYAVIRRVDPVYDASMNVVGTQDPIEYQPGDENKADKPGKPRLNLVTLGTVNADWLNAVSIATSYKFTPSEVFMNFNTKREFVYISNSPLFAVADTWFGDGGRAYMGFQEGETVNVTSQLRNEVSGAITTRQFRIRGKVQDFGADGYGNFFYLTSTDLGSVRAMLDKMIKGDWNKMIGTLEKDVTGGKPVIDTGWRSEFGETLRHITFDVDIYKTVYKISSSVIDEKGAGSGKGPMLGDPLNSSPRPEIAGRVKQATVQVTRVAQKVGAEVSWKSADLIVTDGVDWSAKTAEIAVINIAAPPEVKGVNYWIDLVGNSNTKSTEAGNDAALLTDNVFEGETGEWGIENPPKFDIYGLNENTGEGNNDQNENGIIGGLRNNIIRESLAFHWKVYRVFDVDEMYLPPRENNTGSKGIVGYDPEKTGGKYRQNLLAEFWQVPKSVNGNEVNEYQRKIDSKTIIPNSAWFASLGLPVSYVNEPWKLNYKFPEAGIYKVSCHIEFNLYDYSSMKFGENAGARDGYKKSHWELVDPAWNPADPDKAGRPGFKHFDDIRFVLVTSRGAASDGDYLKKVSVSVLEGASRTPAADIEVDEINRWKLFMPVFGPWLEANKGKGVTPDSVGEQQGNMIDKWKNDFGFVSQVNNMRMEDKDIVGEFAIKWISAFPQRGEDYAEKKKGDDDRESVEKYGGIGVFDYNPDRNDGHSETALSDVFDPTGGSNALCRRGNTDKPQNATQPNREFTLVDKSGSKDAKAYRFRNLGMHGYGTLARSLSKYKLDELQKNLKPADEPWRIKWLPVNSSPWNAYQGDEKTGDRGYPIREIDWDYVRYQWYIAYEINGVVKVEEPPEYSGSVREVLQWCFHHEDRPKPKARKDQRAFVKVLQGSDLPGNGPDLFGDGLDHVKERVPAFHVRFPMLERITEKTASGGLKTVFRSPRWETPIGPRKYHVGLKISAPRMKWRRHTDDKHLAKLADGTPMKEEKSVFWDLVPDPDKKEDMAWCGPNKDNISGNEAIVRTGSGVFGDGLGHVKVFVCDHEPPSFGVVGAGSAEAMLTYPGATTGDKYHKPLRFTIIDNNPNFNPALYPMNTCDLNFRFPDWTNPEMVKRSVDQGDSASKMPELTYLFKPPAYQVRDDTENAFMIPLVKQKENWGAPYSEFLFELPVMPSDNFDSKDLRSGVSDNTTTPYMPADQVGDLFYGLDVKLNYDQKGGPEEAKKFDPTVYNEAKKGFKFNVKDNDPPNLILEVQTSFTEKTRFGIACTDLPFSFADFDNPGKYAQAFSDAVKKPTADLWPEGIRDANAAAVATGTSPVEFGPTELRILDVNESDPKRLPGVLDKDKDLVLVGTGEVRSLDPKYTVIVPKGSRVVFRVQAVDNVPMDKKNQISLQTNEEKCLASEEKNSGNFWVNLSVPGNDDGSRSLRASREIRAAADPVNEVIANVFGTFRKSTPPGQDAVLSVRVSDAEGNKRTIEIPFRVVDTYIKQDRLDLEKERRD